VGNVNRQSYTTANRYGIGEKKGNAGVYTLIMYVFNNSLENNRLVQKAGGV